jgi:hypothetical protein
MEQDAMEPRVIVRPLGNVRVMGSCSVRPRRVTVLTLCILQFASFRVFPKMLLWL